VERKQYATVAVILLVFSAVTLISHDSFSAGLPVHALRASQTGNMLAKLMLYALIVERVTEVYQHAVFSQQKTELAAKTWSEEERVERLKFMFSRMASDVAMSTGNSVAEELRNAEKDLAHVRTDELKKKAIKLDRRIVIHTTIFAIIAGLFISLVGVRVINSLMQIPADPSVGAAASTGAESASNIQAKLRSAVDVIITGLLLAGGAKGLHPIINRVKKLDKNTGKLI